MSRAEHRIIPLFKEDGIPLDFWVVEVRANDLLHPLADKIHTLDIIGGMTSFHVCRNISTV
jgi:hypothetical protein